MGLRPILVVGDLMLDRTWLLAPMPVSSTSQSHADVPPLKTQFPEKQTEVIGGAAAVARAICAMDASVEVILIGEWPESISPESLIPEPGFTRRIKLIHHGKTAFLTEKWRVYVDGSTSDSLKSRFDRDLSKESTRDLLGSKWPSKTDISAVVVMDYGKGFVDQVDVQKHLREYEGLHFMLRSKRNIRHDIFKLPWTVLLPNRDDLRRLVGYSLPPSQQFIRTIGDSLALHPDLIGWLAEVHKTYPNRSVFVKLDKEGGVLLFQTNDVIAFSLAQECRGKWAAIAAGAMLTGALAFKLSTIDPIGLKLPEMRAACKACINEATSFCKANDDVNHVQWIGISFDYTRQDNKIDDKSMGEMTDLLRHVEIARNYGLLLDSGRVALHNANWYLDGFLTVDPEFGNQILRLKAQIKSYFSGTARHQKPYLVAICGDPGAGKSHLAARLEEELECELVSTNAAQWVSMEDLFRFCERIRNVHVKEGSPLAFIDEVDSRVLNENIYGKLLAPASDSHYVMNGEERRLGEVVFLLAGSHTPWDRAEHLRTAGDTDAAPCTDAEDRHKLPDLISRLKFIMEIPSLDKRQADIVYMTGQAFLRAFPSIRYIHSGVFKLFCHSKLVHGPRSITNVVEAFRPLSDPSVVATTDLHEEIPELSLHLKKPHRGWEKDVTPIKIDS
jgi:hypothetical protein